MAMIRNKIKNLECVFVMHWESSRQAKKVKLEILHRVSPFSFI